MDDRAHRIRARFLQLLLRREVITEDQYIAAMEISGGIRERLEISGERVADGPDGAAWFKHSQLSSWKLAELETGETLGWIFQRGRNYPRYEWGVGNVLRRPRESGISLELWDAMYEVDRAVDITLEEGVAAPNPTYDSSLLPPEPIMKIR